jgi:hypothetical protein
LTVRPTELAQWNIQAAEYSAGEAVNIALASAKDNDTYDLAMAKAKAVR